MLGVTKSTIVIGRPGPYKTTSICINLINERKLNIISDENILNCCSVVFFFNAHIWNSNVTIPKCEMVLMEGPILYKTEYCAVTSASFL